MSDPTGIGSDSVRDLQQALAALAAQLAVVTTRVDELARREVTAPSTAAAAPTSWAAPPLVTPARPAPPPVTPAHPAPPPPVTPARPAPPLVTPARPASPPVTPARPASPPVTPARPASPPHPGPIPSAQLPARSWADTAGLKTLGWVGGGVTVLGVVMLLIVAIQHGLLSPLARVIIGVVIGLLLLASGIQLRRKESQAAVAVTFVCTGLAVLYLSAVGAVRLADLAGPLVGHAASIVIVGIAVAVSLRWREPWLAGVSLATSAVLAPVVSDGFDGTVYLFQAVMLAGGGACLLLGLGAAAWTITGTAVAIMVLAGFTTGDLRPVELVVIIVMVVGTWALFIVRWVEGRAPTDPGSFPIRPRSYDPEQIARDYADFYRHTERVDAARADRMLASVSLAIAAGLLVFALAVARSDGIHEVGIGVIGLAFAALFAALAWAAARIPELAFLSLKVVAWSASIACAAIALLRLLDGDARSVSWMVLAVIVLLAVGVERITSMLVPALAVAGISILAAGPALSPRALLVWPSRGLLDGGMLLPRAWTVVLPAGVLVLAVCGAAWLAVSRCRAAALADTKISLQQGAVGNYGYPADDVLAAESRHVTVMSWTMVVCSALACYGLLAITMVFAYAISPTRGGYQGGQITVTVGVTLVAFVLLWQGFRRLVLRLGGLGIAAVAVSKLLLFDTQTLEALPRAMTVIGVGVLLLLAAVAYVMALSRLDTDPAPERGAVAAPAASVD